MGIKVAVAAVLILAVGSGAWWLLPDALVTYDLCTKVVQPDCLTPAEMLAARNDVRTLVLQAVGATFFLITAAFSLQTIRLTREGNETERFASAAGLLANTDPASQLAGVIVLGQHLKVSEDAREPTAELLARFLRKESPAPHQISVPDASDMDPLALRKPAANVALDLLGRSDVPTAGLSLTSTDLRRLIAHNADLRGIDLSGALLNGAELTDCDLRKCHLTGTDFTGAHLVGCDLRDCKVEGADFTGATLTEVPLQRTAAASATWDGAHLTGVWVDNAQVMPDPHRTTIERRNTKCIASQAET
jgi:hypothetical protein